MRPSTFTVSGLLDFVELQTASEALKLRTRR
jgi:hypothetical protein